MKLIFRIIYGILIGSFFSKAKKLIKNIGPFTAVIVAVIGSILGGIIGDCIFNNLIYHHVFELYKIALSINMAFLSLLIFNIIWDKNL